MCEHACVTEIAAIHIFPRALAMGKVGDHYIKGWDKTDEKRLEGASIEVTKTKISEKSALDSLNDEGGL